MFVGIVRIELHIPGARSLKEKRSVVQGLKERIRQRAAHYDVKRFYAQLEQFVEECYVQHQHAYNLRAREQSYPRLLRVHS